MKKVKVNSIKLNCSKGRIEKGEITTLPDDEIAKIVKLRPHVITILDSVEEKPKKVAKKSILKRARNSNGTLKADDPSTPNINEAWEKK